MRSIRLSLVVYFLALLALAMGVASVLAYRISQRTLAEKQQAMAKLIEGQYEQRVLEERRKFDHDLEAQAIGLAGRLSVQFDWGRVYRRHHLFLCLGAIQGGLTPSGYVNIVPWLALMPTPGPVSLVWSANSWLPVPVAPTVRFWFPSPVGFEVSRSVAVKIDLNESELMLPARRGPMTHFQVDTNGWSKSRPSQSLGDRRFPQPDDFGQGKLLHTEADDFELSPGETVRRVRVKASRVKSVTAMPGFRGRPGPSRGEPQVSIVVQAAADLGPLRDKIAPETAARDQALAELDDQSAATLAHMRDRLLLISGLTFAATVVGTFALVWLGLLPLRRLSVAVSQVSTRDFRLPLDGVHMPAELRPIEDRLTETLDLLKRAFAREKQATADISHELRTPLAAMLTTIDLALRKPRSPEQYREFLADCRGSAQAMHQIVERLLTLARIDAGVDRLKPQAVDVDELADQCATVVRPLAEARGLTLSVSHADAGDDAAARLNTDPDKLREVLNNLLHNAIQYNRPEGTIAVTVARSNGHVELAVSDSGIGIPAQARERIFERFYRADPSRTGDGLNAGLGLAIVKEYVELMGGRIRVESEEGRGSTFRIELPVEASVGGKA